jgi:ParB family chromosome partitioning protein
MPDDVFKLGNFAGIPAGDDDDDIDDSEAANGSTAVEPLTSEAIDPAVIKHPTANSGPQAELRNYDGQQFLQIELEKILPNEFQPRRIFNPEKLQELAASIKEHGIIQPLVVLKREDGLFEIIVGERRFRAAKLAGLGTVPVFVKENVTRETKLELALIENIQRTDLNPIEEAKAYQRLQQEFGLKVRQIARRVGKSDPAVSNILRLLNLPMEIQRALIEEKISEGQARPLLSLRDPEEMLQMFRIVLRQQMKVRDIENKVREICQRKIKVQEMFTPDPFLTSLENQLRSKLGTRVQVNRSAKGGRITIEFFSDEELNDIVNKIS